MSDAPSWFDELREHFASHGPRLDRVECVLVNINRHLERLTHMSATLSTDVAALTAAVTGLTDAISNEGSVISTAVAEIQKLLSGNPVDPAALTAIENATSAISTATSTITNAGSTLAAAMATPPAP